MGNKATADSGGQAAIGDIVNSTNITGLIGQLCGNNTIVIQHLHISTGTKEPIKDEPPAGLIAYFDLVQWWNDALTECERVDIEDAVGNEVARDKITATSRSAQSWLRGIALRIAAVHPHLASKIRAKAAGIETGVEMDDYWQRQFDKVQRYWLRQDFEAARDELRAVGYRMREESALPEAGAVYSDLLSRLMHADPYYSEVMAVVLPIVKSTPGVIQAMLVKSFPEFDAARFRHAMYYGEVIGDIKRIKQGRSYGLYPQTVSAS